MKLTYSKYLIPPARRQGRRAFTLYELLIVLMLLTLIGTIAASFTKRVVKSMRGARSQATASAQFDNAVNVLRTDVWEAVEINVVSPREVMLTRADHRHTDWRLGDDQCLRQTAGASAPRRWGQLQSVDFTCNGSSLIVKVADVQHGYGGTFCMVSPVLLFAENKK